MTITSQKLPLPCQRVGVVCGPGEFPKDRQGIVLTTVTNRWGQYAVVLMDSGEIKRCHGLTEVGIGWHLIAAKPAAEVNAPAPAKAIRFMKHYVTDGAIKARAWYSLDNRTDGRKCVTIYAKDYRGGLGEIFAGGEYQNDTDTMTDYFDKGRVVLFEDSPLYAAARARAGAI